MSSYETDFYAWAKEQGALLRAGRLREADVANIAEEIETMGRSEKRELESRLEVLLSHLLKWHVQGDRRGRSWSLTIKEQRRKLERHLADNASLQARLDEVFVEAYVTAVTRAQVETELDQDAFPETFPWTPAQAMAEDFYPS